MNTSELECQDSRLVQCHFECVISTSYCFWYKHPMIHHQNKLKVQAFLPQKQKPKWHHKGTPRSHSSNLSPDRHFGDPLSRATCWSFACFILLMSGFFLISFWHILGTSWATIIHIGNNFLWREAAKCTTENSLKSPRTSTHGLESIYV